MAARRIFPRWGLGLIVLAIVCVGGITLFVQSGLYDVAADAPHSEPVLHLLDAVRARSVAVRAEDVVRPADLDDPKRVAAGAGLYAEMCSGCHLAPGMQPTEISQGLYPRPPLLTRPAGFTPEQEFWVIKHGIKMSGMAAWGPTHSDELIWDMVAFIDKLPSLSAADYQAAIKEAGQAHEHMMQDDDSDHGHEQPH
ncbi:c-type cytochrome [Enhydrobacter sp.]|jgi:mono/diheme cytochrome c family protein|uniref:c-type cytochrome n=1 Tax=Enhydrobacter sp. TaxID=1894999 RepID=UPI00263837BF|nr:c-type cytochrome [Enhydrobacter sp.]WIM12800.1 MAG: Cytochrome c family protein [Enhydrobacter sp.]